MVLHRKSSNIASRCKNFLFNFESFLTLKGPGFSYSGTAGGGDGICLHYLRTNNKEFATIILHQQH